MKNLNQIESWGLSWLPAQASCWAGVGVGTALIDSFPYFSSLKAQIAVSPHAVPPTPNLAPQPHTAGKRRTGGGSKKVPEWAFSRLGQYDSSIFFWDPTNPLTSTAGFSHLCASSEWDKIQVVSSTSLVPGNSVMSMLLLAEVLSHSTS